jgi:outer membrane protein assembly factor BamB
MVLMDTAAPPPAGAATLPTNLPASFPRPETTPMPSRNAAAALALLNLVLALAAWTLLAHRPEPAPTADRTLHLQWVREYPPPRPAWPDQPRMQFDAAYRPVLHQGSVLLGSSHADCVIALDAATGAEHWRFRAEGPVRFAPVAWQDRVYFVADDGYLYCIDAERGLLVWKFRGGPTDRRVLGNERLVSTWPARGAPVVVAEHGEPGDPHHLAPGVGSGEATVYFAAGIWPFMGVFLHALDARTGEVLWTNAGDGSLYLKQPHAGSEAYAGVAPQGTLAVVGDRLLVPGRPVPACYDRATGRLLHYRLADNSKRGGGPEVQGNGRFFVSGGGAFDLASGDYLGPVGWPAVLTPEVLYALAGAEVRAHDARRLVRKGPLVTAGPARLSAAPVPNDVECLAAGGGWLFAGTRGQVFATPLPLREGRTPRVWQAAVDGVPACLVADDERLLVSTREGRIYCFGPHRPVAGGPRRHPWSPSPALPVEDEWGRRAEQVLHESGVRDGYCVSWGVGTGRLVTELALRSRLRIIAIEPDAERAAAVRAELEEADLYGEHVSILTPSSPEESHLPPYLASLMVSEDLAQAGCDGSDAFLRRAFASLRPYGGIACLPLGSERPDLSRWAGDSDLVQARVHEEGNDLWIIRKGPLPGAADWTHEHADAANTRASRDRRVQAPLGLLWFGGPGNQAVLPRHGHGPQPQVVEGRLILEGTDVLRALDVYTGRLLWEASLPGLGKAYDTTLHQPGANATGSNFVSTPAGIYVAHGTACRCLDPATGRETAVFRLPVLPGEREPPAWDFLTVCDDFLVCTANPRAAQPRGKIAPPVSGSKYLFVLDRHTGRLLWQRTAVKTFRHNALCAGRGRLFVIDRPGPQLPAWMKGWADRSAGPARLLALELRLGKEVWSTDRSVFGTWLSYSADQDILVESGRVARDTLADEPKGMRAYGGGDGKVRWYRPDYVGPAMILGDKVIRDRGACDLRSGSPTLHADPLTGKPVEWTWTRSYGCATPLAAEHLLTFRSGAAGFYDLCHDGGTGNIGGFRSGCTNNLIVADGVLSAADCTRQCTCSYQNQSSLALVPMPEAELWTYTGSKKVEGVVRRVGINLGAPGARRGDNGTLWLEFPAVGGPSPRLAVRTRPDRPRWFRKHVLQVEGDGPAWVTASGACGLEELTVPLVPEASRERQRPEEASRERQRPEEASRERQRPEASERTRHYTVRLYFLEPDGLPPGRRRFHVALQGQRVLEGLDVSAEAGGSARGLVKEFSDILAGSALTVTLTPDKTAAVSEPVLCGVEVVAEGW